MTDAGSIMALDLGGVVGWACAIPGGEPTHGSHRLPGERGDAAYFDHFGSWLADMLTINSPRLLVYEAPILTGAKTHFQTAFRLMGLAAITLMIGHRREIRCVESANNASVKKRVLGNGRADKIVMLDEMRRRGWEPRDEHAADALGVLLYAESKHCPKIQRSVGPLFAQPQREAAELVAEPTA